MFASSLGSRAKRRGIVLVVVLGMLGLMALIGVTFATFAGQSLISGRNFNIGVSRPQAEALMDYALAQLINDTNNPLSAIRGHSLLRDMYGNDSVFRGANPFSNPSAETGGLLSSVTNSNGTSSPLRFTHVQLRTAGTGGSSTPFYNQFQYTTNIPTTGQYYGLDFTRWIVRFPYNGVPQTFEILEDDSVNGGGVHLFTLAANLINPTTDPTLTTSNSTTSSSGDWTSFIYADPNLGATVDQSQTVAGQQALHQPGQGCESRGVVGDESFRAVRARRPFHEGVQRRGPVAFGLPGIAGEQQHRPLPLQLRRLRQLPDQRLAPEQSNHLQRDSRRPRLGRHG